MMYGELSKYIVSTGVSVGVLVLFMVCFSLSSAVAESWDIHDRFAGGMLADEDKTDDPQFEGKKLIFNAQYYLQSEESEVSNTRKCCMNPFNKETITGLFEAQVRWNVDNSDIDYARFEFTPTAILWQPENFLNEGLRTKMDLLELGVLRYIKDDSLELDAYLEFSFYRAGRLGSYRWSETSPFTVNAGLQTSGGWAWAKSNDVTYSEVSNPFLGLFFDFSLVHERWGKLYTTNRFVNGFSFSNPSRGHPAAREARARFGYLKHLYGCISMDVFIEKRSFYFTESNLPGLYTWSRTTALELSCHW